MTFASDKLGNLIHCLRFIACGCFLCQGCHIIHVLPIISSRSMLHLLVAARYFSWCFSLSRWDFKSIIFLFPSTCLLADLHTGLSRLMKAFNLFYSVCVECPHQYRAPSLQSALPLVWTCPCMENLDLSPWSLLGKGTFTHMASVFFKLSGLPNCWKCQAGRSSPEGLIWTQLGYIQMTYEAGYKTPPQTPGLI